MAKRVIAVLGDFYHSEELAVKSLELALQQVEEVNVEYITVDQLIESLNTKPDAVILFAENRLNPQDEVVKTWMDDAAAKAISDYVSEGGGWIAWHSGLASFEKFEDYTSMLRGYFLHHPDKHQVVTYYQDKESDFIQLTETFDILDEHYFVSCDEQNTNVFLRSESVDGSSIAGWEHSFGNGRVVCITPAHREEGLTHPVMTKLLVNAINLV